MSKINLLLWYNIVGLVNRKNKKAIEEYIRKQLQENIATDQISIKEYVDPFEKEEKEKERKMKEGLGPLKW